MMNLGMEEKWEMGASTLWEVKKELKARGATEGMLIC